MTAVLVAGAIARDLVLHVADLPDDGGSADVLSRTEVLGGKGANQAVGLRQLGAGRVVLLGVTGADRVGEEMLAAAARDGIDVGQVARRGTTALLVDVVTDGGSRRLLEDVPEESLLTTDDVRRQVAQGLLDDVDTICLQLQQPAESMVELGLAGRARDALLVADGATPERYRDDLLDLVDVVRADAREASSWTDGEVDGLDSARAAARQMLARRPRLVALALPDGGDLVAWEGGDEVLPWPDVDVVDPTGGGDAFVAGLVTALRAGQSPRQAGRLASRAAASTVQRLGGRPDLEAIRVG
jgi:ribokinase